MSDRGGGELFIVDNSVSGWTGLQYLRQWTEIADSFDIATGFFEIGALLALDGKWQQLDEIRILMGDEVSLKTRNAFAEALSLRIGRQRDRPETANGYGFFPLVVRADVGYVTPDRRKVVPVSSRWN